MFGYLKQLKVDGSGEFIVIRIGAESEEALKVKRDFYLADDWSDASQEEYEALQPVAPVEPEAAVEPAA